MEELDDAEGLLGGRGAEGDTVQGEVIDPPGGTTHTSLLSSYTNHHYGRGVTHRLTHFGLLTTRQTMGTSGTLAELGILLKPI